MFANIFSSLRTLAESVVALADQVRRLTANVAKLNDDVEARHGDAVIMLPVGDVASQAVTTVAGPVNRLADLPTADGQPQGHALTNGKARKPAAAK